MTKVDLHYELTKPLDEALLDRISSAPSLFGLSRVQLDPGMTGIQVTYDASRLTVAQVEAALHRAGIPATRKN